MKTAFIFSGQGAQKVGMGKDLYDKYESAREVFDEASKSLGFDIKELIFVGDDAELMKTENTQPAIVTMSAAALAVAKEKGIKSDVVAGLSLGEYTAHIASGSIAFSDAVRLVKKRGKYMQEEVPEGVGAMAAILGLDEETVTECCNEASELGVCSGANFNCPGQIVVSGDARAVEKCCELAKEKGAKRAMLLPVSAPFHCALLDGAGKKLGNELENVSFLKMNIPVITNVTGDYINNESEIKELLIKQVSSSVLWQKTLEKMAADGVDTFIEIGPGKALSGFVKKTVPGALICNIEDEASLEKTLAALSERND